MEELRARLAAALIDTYEVQRVLGQGGMAIVFLAHDRKHDRPVALKVLRQDFVPLVSGRFLQEIKLAASLTHPHIVPLFDSGLADGILYYVMPYFTGETLRERLEREGPLPVEEAVRIVREITDALDFAHRQDIVHRDVKPGNILLQDRHALLSDFGVARAITAAGWEGKPGRRSVAVGTPDYMSPEQATGSDELDGRADVYSLGCVLYEMLTGDPPFMAETAEALMEAQVKRPAPSARAGRSDVPQQLDRAIATALAKRPADRYPSAAAFGAALLAAVEGPAAARRRRRWLASAAAAVLLLGAGAFGLPRVLGANLDPARYVVVPFGHRDGSVPELLNGSQCELLMYQGFRRWRDVRLSDDLQVHDAMLRLGRPVAGLSDAREIARRVGAGRLVWGEIAQFGDSILVKATLYDVRAGAALREGTARLGHDLEGLKRTFTALADSLLLGGARSPASVPGAQRTEHLAAWLAYDSAHSALMEWDLVNAQAALHRALDRDSAFPDAALWLAQVGEWLGQPSTDWGRYARLAQDHEESLGPRERLRAWALARLAAGQHAEACTRFRQLLTQDSLDFAAWYGLGDCHARDRAVIRDDASPSGWRFRGSYHTAAHAYARAFRINPSAHRAFYQKIPALLYLSEPGYLRSGRPLPPDTGWFAGAPALDHDTLAFVPYPFTEMMGTRRDRVPASWGAAIDSNRALQLRITAEWVEAIPRSADAQEGRATALEVAGDPLALIAARRARALTTAADQARRLAVMETRLLLKAEDFEGARHLADSVLRAAGGTPAPTARAAADLAGLAALTGRVRFAAALLRQAAVADTPLAYTGEPVAATGPARGDAGALVALAAFASITPGDSLPRMFARLERYVAGLRPDRRAAAHSALLDQAAVLSFPEAASLETHRRPSRGNYLLDLQADLLAGDTGAVRSALAGVYALRAGGGFRPGDITTTGTYQEAQVLLQLADSAAAVRLLDGLLMDLPGARSDLLPDVAQSASLVRAMALRAELADRAGARASAEWWAKSVLTLWKGADASVAATVERMRAIAGNR